MKKRKKIIVGLRRCQNRQFVYLFFKLKIDIKTFESKSVVEGNSRAQQRMALTKGRHFGTLNITNLDLDP